MSQQTAKLITMINQIADNTPANLDNKNAAEKVAAHVQKFWAKPMKDDIKEYLQAGGEDLNPLAKQAVQLL